MKRQIGLVVVAMLILAAVVWRVATPQTTRRAAPSSAPSVQPSAGLNTDSPAAGDGSPAQPPVASAPAQGAMHAVSGRVLDGEGRPTAATIVAIGDKERVTDERRGEAGADGAFALNLPNGMWWLHAENQGRMSSPTMAYVEDRYGEDRLELTLGATGRVWGFVEDPDGRRLARARILFRSEQAWDPSGIAISSILPDPAPCLHATTDAAGRYDLAVCLGRAAVQADSDGFASASAEIEVVAAQPVQVDLRLSRGVSPHGRVTDSGGEGLAGVEVSVVCAGEGEARVYPDRWEVETDAEGNYSAPSLVVSAFEVYASCKGYIGAEGRPDEKDPSRVDVTLIREGAIEGVVRMRGGAPVPNEAKLGLRSAKGRSSQFIALYDYQPGSKPRIGSDGAFRIEAIPPERYVVQARVEGNSLGESAEFEVHEGETVRGVVVELASSCVLRGTIRDARTGAPIPRAMFGEVTYEPGKGGGYSSRPASEQGRYELRDLAPGRHRFRVSGGKLASKEIAVELHEGEVLDQDILLDEGARISGTVRLDGAAPNKPVTMQASTPTMEQRYLKCGEDGSFEVGGLGPGAWFISAAIGVEDRKTQIAAVRTVDVGKEEVPTIDFDLRSTPEVRGSIRQGGVPCAQCAYYFLGQGTSDGWVWVVWTDERGDFVARGLPAGDYIVVTALSWPQVAADPSTGLQRIAHRPADPVVRLPPGDIDAVVVDLPVGK